MNKKKKGQVGGLPNVVMIIIFAAVFLAVGFLVVQEMLDMEDLSSFEGTATDTNVWINDTTYTLDNADAVAFNSPVITGIVNATGGETIELANATVSSAGVVANATELVFEDVNITYSWKYGAESYLGVNSTVTAFASIPGLLGLLVLVIVVGIIIAVLMGFAPVGRTGTGA